MYVIRGQFYRFIKWVFRKTGLWDRIEDGKLLLDLSVVIPNLIFQRVLGVNRSCPWPVHYTSRVLASENITLGRRVARSFAISGGCYIQAFNGIRFGDDVLFAPGVKIISSDHDAKDGDWVSHIPEPPISLGDHCWIGTNAVILPGVTLGKNVIVGAGAVVTKSFPDDVIIVGNPARILRNREVHIY